MFKTNRQLSYQSAPYGIVTVIPAGTPCILATNLPERKDGKPQYWAEPWPNRSPIAESWQRNYGFLIGPDDVEPSEPASPGKRWTKSIMNGRWLQIDKNTPVCCVPGMDTYWSM